MNAPRRITRTLTTALLLTAVATAPAIAKENKGMSVTKEAIGQTKDGKTVERYTLENANGVKVQVMTYGGIITSVETPDRDGNLDNIVLYKDGVADYEAGHPYFGALVGRYGNRIDKGRFVLDGKTYDLAVNNGPNHLHGGDVGFDKAVWKAKPIERAGVVGVELSHLSPDGDEGYPGNLQIRAEYTLGDDDELTMDYFAETDRPTPVNLTNHSYWNLAGAGSGDVLDQEIMINAKQYVPVDEDLIPTGQLEDVAGTPMDFTTPHSIGGRIGQVDGGYDHCYVVDRAGAAEGRLALCAQVEDKKSGRTMEVYTTEPGVQFYTGNFLDGSDKAGDHAFDKNGGFCLETQHFPDSPNQPQFPSATLRPGETYRHTTVHKFGVKK